MDADIPNLLDFQRKKWTALPSLTFSKKRNLLFACLLYAYCPAIIDITCKDADFPALLDF